MYIIINDEIEYVFLVLRILKLKSHNENQIFINMNHQSYISFNKSSLVGLQAELARKKEEAERNQKYENKKITKLEIKPHIQAHFLNKKKNVPESINNIQEETEEDISLLNQSRESLIIKSKLYDKLRNQELKPEDPDRYLVDFNAEIDNSLTIQEEDDSEQDSEWITFTDALGRSRTCLRSDFEYYKELDTDLKNARNTETVSVTENEDQNGPVKVISEELKLWDKKREELRKKWEEEEKKLTEKRDIHYQDVLFDEARVHGVGYFRFSQDETERQKQQEELKKMREETEKNQMIAMTLKERREQQMRRRIEAAKKRKRERLGVPPEEEIEEINPLLLPDPSETHVKEVQESENLEKKIEEFLQNVERKRHVRPWDVGKEGVEPRVLTQNEWNEKQRAKRVQEFAPPSSYEARIPQDANTLYFTTKKLKSEKPKEYNSVPIQFEYDIEKVHKNDPITDKRKKGVEVPPPVSYENTTSVKETE